MDGRQKRLCHSKDVVEQMRCTVALLAKEKNTHEQEEIINFACLCLSIRRGQSSSLPSTTSRNVLSFL